MIGNYKAGLRLKTTGVLDRLNLDSPLLTIEGEIRSGTLVSTDVQARLSGCEGFTDPVLNLSNCSHILTGAAPIISNIFI